MRARLKYLALALAAVCALPACDTAYANTSSAATSVATPVPSDVIRSSLCTPTVTNVAANSGTEVGGTAVTITGTCFIGSTVATFNSVSGTSLSVASPTSITVTTPAYTTALSSTAADNAVAVAVTNPAGTGTLSAGYTYTSEFARIAGANYFAEYRFNDPRISLNAGGVATLPSFSGNGTLSQGTAANQPTYEAAGWNGGPSAVGDGTNDSLKNNAVTGFGNGKRPYVFLAAQRVSGSSKTLSAMISATGNNTAELQTSASSWIVIRRDSGGGPSTSTGAAFDTNKHLFERGFTAGGTATLVVDGTGTNNAQSGTSNENMTQLAIFSNQDGNLAANMRATWMLVLSDEPDSTTKAALRTAAKSAMWVGFTGSSLNLP